MLQDVDIQPAASETRWTLADLVVFGFVLLALLTWIPSLTERLDPLTGDEPFYVMTSLSLLHDRDLDERNNYLGRDFDSFYPPLGPRPRGWASYPDPLPPHPTASDRPGLYSKHGLGMALLVAVPWQIGGRTLTLALLATIAAGVAVNMAALGRQFGATPALAATVAIVMALTNPLFSFSLLIFPELTAGLCIIYATRRLLALRNAAWQWFMVGLCAAALPWLHYRLATVSMAFAIIAIARFRGTARARDWLAAGSAPLVSGSILLAWHLRLYGSPVPPRADHAGFSGLLGTANGLAGTFLDQQWGAFIHNPLLCIATACAASFAVRFPRPAICLALVVVPYLLLISAYRVWWGEWNPPARYLTGVVPLAAAPLGWWLTAAGGRIRGAVLAAGGLPTLLVTLTFVADPQRMYNHPDGTSKLLETWSEWLGRDLTSLVPSYVFYSASPSWSRFLVAAFAASLTAALAMLLREGLPQTSQRDGAS